MRWSWWSGAETRRAVNPPYRSAQWWVSGRGVLSRVLNAESSGQHLRWRVIVTDTALAPSRSHDKRSRGGRRGSRLPMRLGAVFFALAAAAIVAAWGWLGAPIEMPVAPLGPGEKIPCVSYAPFRGDQDPFGP